MLCKDNVSLENVEHEDTESSLAVGSRLNSSMKIPHFKGF